MESLLSPSSSLRRIVTTARKALVSTSKRYHMNNTTLMRANVRQCRAFWLLVRSSTLGYTNILALHTTGRWDYTALITPGDVFPRR